MEFHFCIATMKWKSRRPSVCGNKSEDRDAPIILYASRDLQLTTQDTDIRVTDRPGHIQCQMAKAHLATSKYWFHPPLQLIVQPALASNSVFHASFSYISFQPRWSRSQFYFRWIWKYGSRVAAVRFYVDA